ncbi:MAG TPA: biotin/lipoyl-binding protein [Propionicimonas sp.]|nr:biotin/lipoyl-binding protein [Propionicimonas sp.]
MTTTETLDTKSPETIEPPTAKKRRFHLSWKTWLVIGLATLLVVGVGVGTWLVLRPKGNAAGRSFSQTAEATVATQTLSVSLDGTLSPSKQSDVSFGVSGTVTSVKVKAGDKVTKGDKLAAIDNSSLEDAVDLARANLTSAQANLDEVEDNDGSDAAINAASAQVDSAKAALSSAKENLEDAVLRSPISGTVATVNVEVGDTVGSSSSSSGSSGATSAGASTTSSSSSAQFVVIATSKWKLSGSVGAADLSTIKAGQAATVTISGNEVEGEVASVGIVATSTSDGAATFPVVINLSGTHEDLYSGTTASAVITTGSYPDVLTVPTAAITTQDGKTVVTKVDGSSTSQVEVEIGQVFGSNTEITSGISEGDTVQITFVRPSSSSTSSTEQEQGGGFSGLGGITGGGQPPAGGGQPPAGAGGR